MKISLSGPKDPYSCEIDSDVMDVEIRDAFLGVGFVTEDGEKLSVCMRDTGFEVRHTDSNGVSTKWIEFKGDNEEAIK